MSLPGTSKSDTYQSQPWARLLEVIKPTRNLCHIYFLHFNVLNIRYTQSFQWAFIWILALHIPHFHILRSKSLSTSGSFPFGWFGGENHEIKPTHLFMVLALLFPRYRACSCLSFMNHCKNPSLPCSAIAPRSNSSIFLLGHLLSL